MNYVACIERDQGFSSYRTELTESSLDLLLDSIKEYADHADECDRLCILGSTNDPDIWEQIADCWETYVVPAIEKRELDNEIQLVEGIIAHEESWFFNLESIKAQKEQYLEEQYSRLKQLKEQQ